MNMKAETIGRAVTGSLLILIRLYKHTLSLLIGPCCRFSPSCSSYAIESVERFGTLGGIRLTAKRLIKCHPFHPGGYDPVPEIKNL